MFVKNFVFFDDTSSSTTSNAFVNSEQGEVMSLQVEGSTVNIQFQCQEDTESSQWFPVKVYSKAEAKMISNITSAGLYLLPMVGERKCRAINNGAAGSVRVFGCLLK